MKKILFASVTVIALIVSLVSCVNSETKTETDHYLPSGETGATVMQSTNNDYTSESFLNTSCETTDALSATTDITQSSISSASVSDTDIADDPYLNWRGGKDFATETYDLNLSEQEFSDWLNGISDKTVFDVPDNENEQFISLYDHPMYESIREMILQRNMQKNILIVLSDGEKLPVYEKNISFEFKDTSLFSIEYTLSYKESYMYCDCTYFDKKYDAVLSEGFLALRNEFYDYKGATLWFPSDYEINDYSKEKIKIFDYDSGTAVEVEVYKRKYDKQYTVGDIEPHTEYFFIYKDCMIRMDFHNFNEEELKTFGFIGVDYGKYNPKRVWWK